MVIPPLSLVLSYDMAYKKGVKSTLCGIKIV